MPSDWPQNAHPVTRVIGSEGTAALTFEVPAGVVLRVESVYAEFDTSGGAAAPLLTVTDDSGAVIARKRQTETADDPALSSATWALRLSDDSGSLPTGFGLGAMVSREAPLGSQAIGNNLIPLIVFNVVHWASPGMVDLVTNPSFITLTVDGIWLVTGILSWTGNAGDADARQVLVDQVPNVGPNLWQSGVYKFDAQNFNQVVTGHMRLAAGTVLRLRALQRSGGTRNTFGILQCQWLGPLI